VNGKLGSQCFAMLCVLELPVGVNFLAPTQKVTEESICRSKPILAHNSPNVVAGFHSSHLPSLRTDLTPQRCNNSQWRTRRKIWTFRSP